MDANIRLAACYTVFNACELLKSSMKQIYDQVDVVVIAWQPVSNRGESISRKDLKIIQSLRHDPKVHMVYFTPDLLLSTKENERNKHQAMIDEAKRLECSHFLMSATDHFYDSKEFMKAKAIAVSYDLTASKMYTYYKKPTWRMDPIEQYYMPFIMKLKPETKITRKQYDFVVDPSVRIEPVENTFLFPEATLMMHHYSMVRDDIESKFKNSASAGNWPEKVPAFLEEYQDAEVGKSISYFKGTTIIEMPDIFDLGDI